MGRRDWTPKLGASALAQELGTDAAVACLTSLMVGEVGSAELREEPWPGVLLHIGDGHAARIDPSDPRLSYWARTWAARALAYVGNESVAPWLLRALTDDHWRVRMTAVQTLGRLGIAGVSEEVSLLVEDPHRRVREAAEVALGRL